MSKALLSLMLLVNFAHAESLDYTKLQMRDLDQMRALISPTMKSAASKVEDDDSTGGTEAYRDVLKMILSRPNSDNLVSQLMSEPRSALKDLGALEDTVENIVIEAIFALTKGKEEPRRKATNVFLLQNVVSEFKPDIKNNPEMRIVFSKIRDADIKISKDVRKELLLRGMVQNPVSPSQLAIDVIGKKP